MFVPGKYWRLYIECSDGIQIRFCTIAPEKTSLDCFEKDSWCLLQFGLQVRFSSTYWKGTLNNTILLLFSWSIFGMGILSEFEYWQQKTNLNLKYTTEYPLVHASRYLYDKYFFNRKSWQLGEIWPLPRNTFFIITCGMHSNPISSTFFRKR